jgi:chromosome segregation ATPase
MAEKIEIDVNLKESLDKVVGATRGLKLDEGQKQRLEKYSRGAQLALDSNEIKEFQKNFNNIIGLFKQAAAATGNLASTIKEITDKQSILNRLINELKDKRTVAESKLTKDGTRLTKKAANQFAKESGDAQKVVTSNGKVATRDEIISLQQALAQFIQKTGKAITQVTNEDLKSIQTDSGLTFKNRSAMFAAQRYVAAEKAYTTDVQNEITGLNADITAKESEYATLTQNLTRMSEAANTGASRISNLYSEITKLANNVNTAVTNQKNKQQLENIDRDAAPDLPKDIKGLQADRNANNKGLGRALKQFSLYAFVIRGLKRA